MFPVKQARWAASIERGGVLRGGVSSLGEMRIDWGNRSLWSRLGCAQVG